MKQDLFESSTEGSIIECLLLCTQKDSDIILSQPQACRNTYQR